MPSASRRKTEFPRGEASLSIHPDFCIEMGTGTGKALIYLRTIYELCREYGFTKFIILVPSVPIREGVLDTIEPSANSSSDSTISASTPSSMTAKSSPR